MVYRHLVLAAACRALDDLVIICISGECHKHDDSNLARESYGLHTEQLSYSATDVAGGS